MRLVLPLIVMVVVAACSSVPDFRPSKPLEEASSLNEAIEICTEYAIKGDQNGSGRARPVRVAALVPWMRCYESIFRKFPEAVGRVSFVHFFRALQVRHDATEPPDAEAVNWPLTNYAVRHAINHIKNEAEPYSEAELSAIEGEFPQYGLYLAESGKIMNQMSANDVRQQRLSEVRRDLGVVGLDRDQIMRLPPRPIPLNEEQKEYCHKYRNYRSLVFNAEELGDYKRVLDDRTYADGGNRNELRIREKVNGRYEALKKDVKQQNTELTARFKELQQSASWFRNGYCLQR